MFKYVSSVLLSLFASTAVFGQSLDDRVRDLERRVEQLERQSGKQSATTGSQSQLVGGEDGWKRRENWRALKRGMTEADVMGLLGEAYKVVNFGSFTVWYYDRGNLQFESNGRLRAWTEP